jgi:hypothetical protein
MFKRNQVEEALALVLEPVAGRPSRELRTRIKRLLDTDRGLGRNKRSKDPERANFAFYSINAGGRGTENWFSDYEAFALLTGLRLMRQGWPQGYVVAVLRRVKRELQRHYGRVLKQNPVNPFKDQKSEQQARAGDIDLGYPNPLFLVIISKDELDHSGPKQAAIFLNQVELMGFIKKQAVGTTWTMFDLLNSVHALSSALAKSQPRKRGRGSR